MSPGRLRRRWSSGAWLSSSSVSALDPAIAGDDDGLFEAGNALPELGSQSAEVVPALAIDRDVGLRLGEFEEVLDLAAPVRGQGEDGDRTEFEQCEDEPEIDRDVRQMDDHPIAATDSSGPQARGEAKHLIPELGVAEALLAEDHGGAIGMP